MQYKKFILLSFLLFFVRPAQSAVENVALTKHNLSAPSSASVKSKDPILGGTDNICIFCHTPHSAQNDTPLWNRSVNTSIIYNMYDSTVSKSMEASVEPQPSGYSKLCLSCHDGTIAIGKIINAPGAGNFNPNRQPSKYIPMQGTYIDGTMPQGSGIQTGDTRVMGTDLTNDHPISFVLDQNLADTDGELILPDSVVQSMNRWGAYTGVKRYPLYLGDTQKNAVQCTSCHNPHSAEYPKFLREPRFNNATEDFTLTPNGPTLTAPAGKILCLSCHDKDNHGWTGSAHDQSPATHKEYPGPTNPYIYNGQHTVGEYACRICHDPHTNPNSKRLHIAGSDSSGAESTENTCFLCHSPENTAVDLQGNLFIFGPTTGFTGTGNRQAAPDVYSQFKKDSKGLGTGSGMDLTLGQGHEPVFINRPAEGVELLGSTNPPNRYRTGDMQPDTLHIECTDCHNPHQVTGSNFTPQGEPPNRLKGMKGINIKGDVVGKEGAFPITDNREPLIYEVCFRCHGNSYNTIFPKGSRFPDDITPVPRPNKLPPGTNPNQNIIHQSIRTDPSMGRIANSFSFKGYSNKRLEFSPFDNGTQVDGSRFPLVTSGPDAGADPLRGPYFSSSQTGSQILKAFHPVSVKGRNNGTTQYTPTYNALNNQLVGGLTTDSTIMCTDCHNTDDIGNIKGAVTVSDGEDDPALTARGAFRNDDPPDPGFMTIENDPQKAIGPHGSKNIRVLRGNYYTDVRNWTDHDHDVTGDAEFELCFRCHNKNTFLTPTAVLPRSTNFFGDISLSTGGWAWQGNLHRYHVIRARAHCHDCHMNIHSNVQAENTIYGKDPENPTLGGVGPPDGNTHLINFNPVTVSGFASRKPRWYYIESSLNGRFICSLRCHNATMAECTYGFPRGGSLCALPG